MKKFSNWRINLVFVFLCLLGAAIISRLFFLQILERKLFQAQAFGQQVGLASVQGSRGQIFCENSQESKGKNGSEEIRALAINEDRWLITASKKDIADKVLFAEKISAIISMPKEEIISLLEGEDAYAVIKKDLSSEVLENIKKLNIKGLSWRNEPARFYPQAQLASHVLGFLGGLGTGQYGIEGYYDDIIGGKVGVKKEKTGLDAIFSNSEEKISLDGSDIYLTIDYNIQFQAESLLEKAKDKLDIESGQIIVMKPDTGKIIALANYPFFNPNEYSKVNNLEIFQNGAVQKLFEPGSIMKPFTMASAINEGKITPSTTYVDTGSLKYGKYTIHNFANEIYGKQTMTQVLESSINTGAVFAEEQLSHQKFLDYLDKFGFFQKTKIDLQGEVYSQNDLLKNGSDINFATASFGQGIELTPMQIARGFCALANGGNLVKPYIVEKIINGKDGTYTKPDVLESVISKESASQVTSMLINVVDKGFNSVAKIPGYYLAGKTGTAQVPLKNGKGYEPDKTIQSFVGYGPALNPEFLILVKLDNPKVAKSALSAVPVFKELSQYIINYWKIPPDYDSTKK